MKVVISQELLAGALGAGPRDGIMTALVDRGGSLRVIRTAMEVTVLVGGFLVKYVIMAAGQA